MNRYRVELRDDEDCSSVWYGNASIIESAIAKAKKEHRQSFGEFKPLNQRDLDVARRFYGATESLKVRDFVYIKAAKVD